jgi:hypothetical protein
VTLRADSRRLILVQLGKVNGGVIVKSDARDAFSLSPSSPSVDSPQARDLPNAGTDGECLDMRAFADDGEVHGRIVSNVAAGATERDLNAAAGKRLQPRIGRCLWACCFTRRL